MKSFVSLFHIFFVSVLLFYVGTRGSSLAPVWYPILMGLGAVIVLYHAYKATLKKDAWVNYFHILVLGPLLFYIGYTGAATARKWFEFVLMLGFASFGYHTYYLLTE